ncbi:uncharacterized protein PRCAT00002947001 [Priceomyces carsonii]|uniref:uncharacterized protein n=1 Tax=Priceomyces carsonii TaxID=28549 RepID=UPI002EDB6AC7|nr:unnamed protein product [Priceomyces carsonii]
MSLSHNRNKELPQVPIVLRNDDLEEINIAEHKEVYGNRQTHQGFKTLKSQESHGSSHGRQKNSSKKVTRQLSGDVDSSQFVIRIDKTPSNLTPSQRLHLRRLQLSNSISKLNTSIPEARAAVTFDQEDQELDENEYLFNVPMSHLFQYYELEGSGNKNGTESTTMVSTRASSIMSENNHNRSASVSSSDCDEMNEEGTASNFKNNLNINPLGLSADAFKLSELYSRCEVNLIYDEDRKHKKMLSEFKRVNKELIRPTLDATKYQSSPTVNQLYQAKSEISHRSMPSLPLLSSSLQKTSNTENYLSFTRPIWLPPKSSRDKVRHQRETENMLHRALAQESKSRASKVRKVEQISRAKEKDIKKWRQLVEAEFEGTREDEHSIEKMCSRGIPEECRASVWWLKIGNVLRLDGNDCENYFAQSDEIIKDLQKTYSTEHYFPLKRLDGEPSPNKKMTPDSQCFLHLGKLYNSIRNDTLNVFPDLNFYRRNDVSLRLSKTVLSFLIYMGGRQTKEARCIQPEDLYFEGLINIAALLYYHYRSTSMTFISLCNLFDHRHLPGFLLLLSSNSETTGPNNKLLEEFYEQFNRLFRANLNRLFTHFRVVGISPQEYIPQIFMNFFSSLLNFDMSCHVLDLYIFEGDLFLTKCLLGIFKQISHKLFGCKEEILKIISGKAEHISDYRLSLHINQNFQKHLTVGYEHELIESIKKIQM